ncbi:hypothetical protein [Haladaptatus sp. NG-SE-30]
MTVACPDCGKTVYFVSFDSLDDVRLSCGCLIPTAVWRHFERQSQQEECGL